MTSVDSERNGHCGPKRLDYFDMAKGIAILCVILGHLGVRDIDRVVVVFHMPLFFFVSGYFLSRKKYDYLSFVKKKVRSLLKPYYFTGMIICLFSIPLAFYTGRPVLDTLWGWIGGTLYGAGVIGIHHLFHWMPIFIGALWFLWAIFWGVLVVRRVIDVVPEQYQFIAILLITWVGYQTAQTIWLPLDIQAGFFATLFIYLGYWSKERQLFEQRISWEIIALCLGIVVWCIKYFKGLAMVVNVCGNGIMDIIGALAAIYLIILACKRLEHTPMISSTLVWYGKNSIIVLAFHIIELDLVPWNLVQDRLLSSGLPFAGSIAVIIIIKFLWATFGILLVTHSSFLRKIYLTR